MIKQSLHLPQENTGEKITAICQKEITFPELLISYKIFQQLFYWKRGCKFSL